MMQYHLKFNALIVVTALFLVAYVFFTYRDVPSVTTMPSMRDSFSFENIKSRHVFDVDSESLSNEDRNSLTFDKFFNNLSTEIKKPRNASTLHQKTRRQRKNSNRNKTRVSTESVNENQELIGVTKVPPHLNSIDEARGENKLDLGRSNFDFMNSSRIQENNLNHHNGVESGVPKLNGRKVRWLDGKIQGLSSLGIINIPDFSDKPYLPYLVESNGTFLERVHSYNVGIEKIRKEIHQRRGFMEWQDVKEPNELTVVWGSVDDFLERLSNHKEVLTVILPWRKFSKSWSHWNSTKDTSNILVKEYFEWSATQPLCEWIETPGFTKAHWDAVYNRNCNVDMSLTAKPRSLEWLYFHGKPINIRHYWPNDGLSYPSEFYISPPLAIFYVNILEDAVINLSGDVISGGIKVVPYTCSHDFIPTIPIEYRERPIYRDVFVVTQFWGTTYFHKMLEVMPRIAPYVEFLKNNPSVLIHAPEDHAQISEFLEVLGLNPERIVTGVTRAKLVYLPQGTPCGFPNVHDIQILSQHYRNFIYKNLVPGPRNRLVLVKRSGLRRFLQQEAIEQVLQAVAHAYNLNYTLFSDSPSPSLHNAMSIFNSAKIIVAPHGAGLSNMIFSEPRTLVIEGVCNPPHVNMCFQFAAHSLGHRYHGIPSENGCESIVSVAPETVDEVVRKLIDVDS